ncbi:type II toxin-antitoxin system VapC family toxin [Candidatus Poriferisodalis sp.]|uniref:type II toxin-antitoxin system VapC family toxin n=1 Tax=Candidatus Poriferisodalis sp. TaxID=3101277 RepID=UPI003B5CAD63
MALSRGLADTSIFIARETGRPVRTEAIPDQLSVSIVTIGELRVGVLRAADTVVRDRRLSTLANALALQPLPIDTDVAAAWALLRVTLRERGMAMPINDSWIAATALAHEVPVVTQDQDFPAIDGLSVIQV